jgi:hypothetical protein
VNRPYHTAGSLNGQAKLTEQSVKEIRTRRAAGEKRKDLAEEFGVGIYAIRDCCSGTTWGWLD